MTGPFTTSLTPDLLASRGPARALALAAALVVAGLAAEARAEPAGCPGCVLRVPPVPAGASPNAPRPLLVALHGDGGGLSKLVRAWSKPCDAAGVILFAPRCPIEKGCRTGSWWQWLASPQHDAGWLGAQIDAVVGQLPIDRDRVYATGYSGGATYLGWYAPEFPKRFAAVAYVSGGNAYGVTCPACKLPVLFVIGGLDPMITPYTRPLYEYYRACGGHEAAWEQLHGVSHEGMLDVLPAGRGAKILDWLFAHPSACAEPPDAGAIEAVAVEPADAGPVVDAAPAARPDPDASPRRPTAELPPRASACACDLAGRADDGAAPLALLALLALRRRPR